MQLPCNPTESGYWVNGSKWCVHVHMHALLRIKPRASYYTYALQHSYYLQPSLLKSDSCCTTPNVAINDLFTQSTGQWTFSQGQGNADSAGQGEAVFPLWSYDTCAEG